MRPVHSDGSGQFEPEHQAGATGLDTLPDTVAELAGRYVAEIRTVQPQGPYHLLGWSLGGTIAEEMAVQLRETGECVSALAMIDTVLIDTVLIDTVLPEFQLDEPATPGVAAMLGQFGVSVGHVTDEVTLEDAAKIVRAIYPGLDFVTADGLQQLREPVGQLRRIADSHRPRFFDGNMEFFAAAKDLDQHPNLVDRWREYIGGTVAEYHVDASHTAMADPGPLREIGRVLADRTP